MDNFSAPPPQTSHRHFPYFYCQHTEAITVPAPSTSYTSTTQDGTTGTGTHHNYQKQLLTAGTLHTSGRMKHSYINATIRPDFIILLTFRILQSIQNTNTQRVAILLTDQVKEFCLIFYLNNGYNYSFNGRH